MPTIEGVVILAQESRFQLSDDAGVAHLFLLSHRAAAQSYDLASLQARQARIRVSFTNAGNLKAGVAHRVELCEAGAQSR